MGENKVSTIDWSKFKNNAKGKMLEVIKNSYIEFCEMLKEIDFELVSNYVGNKEKVELVYKFDDSVRLNMSSHDFKRCTYKAIINFKANLNKNNDKFINFVGLTDNRSLVAKIKTFDGGVVKIDISRYVLWDKGRRDFYNKLKEVNGHTVDYYKDKSAKMNMCVDDVKLNSMCPSNFKNQTYKAIINFKKQLKENNDEFIKFIGLSESGKLIAEIKTFDNGRVSMDLSRYNSFNKCRKNTYNYCISKKYKILSPYVGALDKMLIDFNCRHEPHWITPSHLKQNKSCPVCDESKGEKAIRLYLEKNNMEFIQEYRFEDCKHKRSLPFDFYLPQYNLCIEFDGIQHFESSEFFGGKSVFKDTKIRDKIKNNYCKDNNINLLRIPYYNINSIEDILDKEFDRLRELNNKIA